MDPTHLQVLVCLPLTIERYRAQRRRPQDHDFVLQMGSPSRFERQFGARARSLVAMLRSQGCEVVEDVTLFDLRQEMTRDYSVTVLVAHWAGDDMMECADGLATCDSVADALLAGRREIIDLCVCHPVGLVRALKSRSATVLRCRLGDVSRPLLWLGLYVVAARLLRSGSLSYADAVVGATRAMGGVEEIQ